MVQEKVWLGVARAIRRVGDRVREGQNTETVRGVTTHIEATYLPMKMEQTESAFKLQASGNYPKESIHHTELSCGTWALFIMI
jgi:hypothetical protein